LHYQLLLTTKINTMENQLKQFNAYINDFINDRLSDYEGVDLYACDLAYTLTEGINMDGTATYSTYLAKEYIKLWFDEASEYYEYEISNFGKNLHNPFESPEAFMVCMIIYGVESKLQESDYLNENWNDKITLTSKVIDIIKNESIN